MPPKVRGAGSRSEETLEECITNAREQGNASPHDISEVSVGRHVRRLTGTDKLYDVIPLPVLAEHEGRADQPSRSVYMHLLTNWLAGVTTMEMQAEAENFPQAAEEIRAIKALISAQALSGDVLRLNSGGRTYICFALSLTKE